MESSSRLSSGPLSKPVNLIEHPLSHPFHPPRIHFIQFSFFEPPPSLLPRSQLLPAIVLVKVEVIVEFVLTQKKKKKRKNPSAFSIRQIALGNSWTISVPPYYLHLTQPRRISVNSWDSIKKEKIEINSKKDSFKFDSQKKLGPRNRFTEGWSFLLVFPN